MRLHYFLKGELTLLEGPASMNDKFRTGDHKMRRELSMDQNFKSATFP